MSERVSVLATEQHFRVAFVQVGSSNVGVGAGGAEVGGRPGAAPPPPAIGGSILIITFTLRCCVRDRESETRPRTTFLRVAAICKLGVAIYDGLKYVEGGSSHCSILP